MDPAGLRAFADSAAQSRYLLVAVYWWVVYDWITTLGQEIDLVWKRSGAWTSKFLYAFTRYNGIALIGLNVTVAVNEGWSPEFCRSYFFAQGFLWMAQTAAVQGALLLRIYVMHQRSTTILLLNSLILGCEVVSLTTIIALDVARFKATPGIRGVPGCWSVKLNHNFGTAIWWISLSFETYLCALMLGPAVSYWKSSKQTSGAKILSILIRDSFVWYFTLAACLFVNAIAWTTNTPKLVLTSVPILNSALSVGGPRLLLNVRAAYFSSVRNPSSTAVRRSENTDYTETEGTVGRFWSSGIGGKDGDGDQEDCAASISMGIWSNKDVERNLPPSPPPVLMLKPAPLGRRCLKQPSPSFVVGGDEEGAPASSGLSMGSDDHDKRQRGSEVSVPDLTPLCTSCLVIEDCIQPTKYQEEELENRKEHV